jgi:hypothetical protein
MRKTNNSNLTLKIELRRTVLRAAGFPSLRILDLFAGGGEIWNPLCREFKTAAYMPCDVKPQMPGTLKANVTPLFVEALAGGNFNVVDIDTYGEPWEIWAAVASRLRRPAAIFLTHRVVGMGQTSHFALETMGIPRRWPVPVKPQLARFAGCYFLIPSFAGLEVRRAWNAQAGNAAYFGLLAAPREDKAIIRNGLSKL